jgi:hypothetical protein
VVLLGALEPVLLSGVVVVEPLLVELVPVELLPLP